MRKFLSWMKNPLALMGMLLLTACQTTSPAPEIQTPPPPVVEAVGPEVPALPPEPVVIETIKPRFVISNIMNLAPDTLENILGTPSLKRKEKDARVWLFRNSECILHLYFYPNDNGDFRLDYVETAAVDLHSDNPTVSPNACLNSHIIPEKDLP